MYAFESQKPQFVVMCRECGHSHYSAEVHSIDIESDPITDADIVTFICPETEKETKSNLFREF